MAKRTGEKVGWTVGWLGGFIWMAILAVIFLMQQKWIQGFLGIFLFAIAVASIISFAPWRHPSIPYWRLMIPSYVALLGSVVWAVWSFGGIEKLGFNGMHLLWIVPLLIPFGSVGRRTWNDFHAPHDAAADGQPTDADC